MSKELSLQSTIDLLKNAHQLTLVSHIGPDGDTLGSTLALAAGLKQAGKKVTIMVDDTISSTYSFMPGLSGYVRPEAGKKIPGDLVVVIDASSKDRMGLAEECVTGPILNIDHHISNTKFADYLYLDATAAATGEIIYALLTQWPLTITREIATCLYVAIVTDCGYFKYSNTTPRTMRIAADLLAMGLEPSSISDQLELKTKATMELLQKVITTLAFAEQGKIATMEISRANYDKAIDTDSFISYPRYIEGVEVAAMFKEVEENVTRVSMRSRFLDVSKIALTFKGGGHKKAAGCTIYAPLEAAKASLLAALVKEMRLAE